MGKQMTRVLVGLLVATALVAAGSAPGHGQPAQSGPFTVRVADVAQWVLMQHGIPASTAGRQGSPALRSVLDQGVADRAVFWWERGRIERRWGLVAKPVRVLSGPEAAALGGRGQFDLVGVRPPRGSAAWTEVDVVARPPEPEPVLLLEIGGDRGTWGQVLATFLVATGNGTFQGFVLSPQALVRGPGVQVVMAPFGLPLEDRAAALFQEADGLGVLVARSLTPAITSGGASSNGPADVASASVGDWREGDRVILRVPLTTLRRGVPPIVLGWRDRIEKPGGNEGHERPTP